MSSNQAPQNPHTNPQRPSSSTNAQRGSSRGRISGGPAPRTETRERNEHLSEYDCMQRFMRDERDHRSLNVEEFDDHQDEAKKRHKEELAKIVAKQY